MIKEKEVRDDEHQPALPFILNFLEYRDGAMSITTSGSLPAIDGADWD